jgi:hypothetical protein
MLKEAALTTLKINNIAIQYGMMLKDASAYNIQPYKDWMRLIDTTSFMFYSNDTIWPAYSQFLRHFITPLLWMKYYNVGKLSEIYIDGIPVSLTAKMLPWYTKLLPKYWAHIFLQSFADTFKTDRTKPIKTPKINTVMSTAFLGNLYKFVESINYNPKGGRGWTNYAEAGSYTNESQTDKDRIVSMLLSGKRLDLKGSTVLDLGCNTGFYSRLAQNKGFSVISVDSDHDCILKLYAEPDILPLVVDICNPSPGIGWDNTERLSFWTRISKVKIIMALALIHHLSIRNNVPLALVADLFADHCSTLIIEWVPLEDKQAKRLLGSRRNIPEYNIDVFSEAFGRRFDISQPFKIEGSDRVIYQMENKDQYEEV